MHPSVFPLLSFSLLLLCGFAAGDVVCPGDSGSLSIAPSGEKSEAMSEARTKVEQFMAGPSVFVANRGQWDQSIRFALDGLGANVGITDKGPRFQLFRQEKGAQGDGGAGVQPSKPAAMHEFAVVFDGALPTTPTGRQRSERTFNYLTGEAANHREGVPAFSAVWYEDLYPGIDLELTGRRTGLKYTFHVAPGKDWRAIRVRYDGIGGLSLRPDGTIDIAVACDWDAITDGSPYIYQEANGKTRPVAGRFTLVDDHTYGFEIVGEYDPTLAIVIDPDIEWSAYLGGSEVDSGQCIAVDNSGNVYVTGYTQSSDWVSGGWDTTANGNYDGFVVKLSSLGGPVWSTYLGGAGRDIGHGIALDGSGNVYVTGETKSSGWTSGGWNTTLSGSDGFAVKLDSAGAHIWSSYLGGTRDDYARGILADTDGNVYIAGSTDSSGWVSGGWDADLGPGKVDAYVVKLSGAGSHEWSTYLGGIDDARGTGIAMDLSGNVYVAAYTFEMGCAEFGDCAEVAKGGNIIKLTNSGAHVWSSALAEPFHGLAVNSSSEVYIAGESYGLKGGLDGYVSKLDAAGAPIWTASLGGSSDDSCQAIALDGDGNVLVTGETGSSEWTTGGWDITQNGQVDGFIMKLTSAGAPVWSSYIGGGQFDYATAITVDSSGRAYVTGYEWDGLGNGERSCFVAKVDTTVTAAGSLHVGLTPPEAIAVGAQWRRVYTTVWLDSGATETGVPVGEWLIEFKDVLGFAPPERLVVDVSAETVTDAAAAYRQVPGDLSWSTCLAGTMMSSLEGPPTIAMDAEGGIYVGGTAYSTGWVSGGWDTIFNGSTDGYVAKLSSSGAAEWSTYIGGDDDDGVRGLAVDNNGNIYATGSTKFYDWVSGGWDTSFGGRTDGFLVKLSASGGHLWSTYLGGIQDDIGEAVDTDSSGNVYVTGVTESSSWISGGLDSSLGGPRDGFVVKLTGLGAYVWSTCLGGTSYDGANDIVVEGDANVYVAGSTSSANWATGGWDTILDGSDGYVAKLDSAGALVWSSYVGGSSSDGVGGIAVGGDGNVYLSGATRDPAWVSGGWNAGVAPSIQNYLDAFVVKVSSAGDHLWSSYFGRDGEDRGDAVAVDTAGNVYVTGCTETFDWASGGWDTSSVGFSRLGTADGYVVKLNAAGNHLWSSYVGGGGYGNGCDIALGAGGRVYVAGLTTNSSWVSLSHVPGFQPGYPGTFVAEIIQVTVPMSSPAADTTDTTPTWSWSSGGGAGVFRYRLDEQKADWVITTATTYTPDTPLSEGAHTLYVQERDSDNNWSFQSALTIAVDLTPPSIVIGAPSAPSTHHGPITYTVSYSGATEVTLSHANITLLGTGTASGDLTVSGSGGAQRTVTISDITGDGTMAIRIASGTAADAAGNSAPARGPSESFYAGNAEADSSTLPLKTWPAVLALSLVTALMLRRRCHRQKNY